MPTMTKRAFDAAFTPTSRTLTEEGYLCVKGIAARTGVYQYLSTELDLPGPERVVNVYRPPEEVFSAESLASYADKDVANDHPEDMITSATYRDHSVGHVRGAVQEGQNVVVDMIIKDQEAIDDINSGKAELSPGYVAAYVEKAGVDPFGTPYEFEQQGIVINHVALVDAARAGKIARLFDRKPKGENMTQRKVFLDAKKTRSVTLDEDAAAVVDAAIAQLMDEVSEAEKKADAAEAKADAAEEKADEADKKSNDAAIGERVKSILSTRDAAAKVCKSFDSAGLMDVNAIKRGALAGRRPSIDWAAKSAAYVEAAFDAAMEEGEEEEKEEKKETDDSRANLLKLAKDFQTVDTVRATSDGRKAYDNFLKGAK